MEINVLVIQLNPNYNSTAKGLGFDLEADDIDNDAVLFSQGFNIEEIEVQPGEKFKISNKFEDGVVSCEEVEYKLIKRNFVGNKETIEGEDTITLDPGTYIYHLDGVTIEQLVTTNDDSDDNDM